MEFVTDAKEEVIGIPSVILKIGSFGQKGSFMEYFKNKRELDNFITINFKGLALAKAKGYYYFYSNNESLANKLCILESTSVYVNNYKDLTKQQWADEIEFIKSKILKATNF